MKKLFIAVIGVVVLGGAAFAALEQGKEPTLETSLNKTEEQTACSEDLFINFHGLQLNIPKNSGNISIVRKKDYPCDGIVNMPEHPQEKNQLRYIVQDFFGVQNNSIGGVGTVKWIQRDDKAQDSYTKELKRIQELQNLDNTLKNFPVQNGFYEFEYKQNSFVYLSKDKNLKTYLGNPYLILCRKNIESIQKKYKDMLYCSFDIAWTEKIEIGFSGWNTSEIPRNKWENLIPYFENFIEDVGVTDNPDYQKLK